MIYLRFRSAVQVCWLACFLAPVAFAQGSPDMMAVWQGKAPK
jgi:hypothetical protein